MVEIRIHGRGGQGGVTLAKLIATARFLQGDAVQAFGLYAAERSGAPVQAFCRYDPDGITDRNLIYEPDHVVVLDPTLIGPDLVAGLAPGGWIVLNTPDGLADHGDAFPHNRVATVDATAIARRHDLGTRTVPIVNTALLGAVSRVLGFSLREVEEALVHLGFGGGNLAAARDAWDAVVTEGTWRPPDDGRRPAAVPGARASGVSVLTAAPSAPPAIRTGTWATERPRRQQQVPPCNHVCPAGNDVQGFLHALAGDRTDDALEILLRTTPFPAVCGRICPAPCMESCNRIHLDGAVNVRELERWAGDHGRASVRREASRPERVAVVGSGPGGLTAAYHLARMGYDVRVFEAAPRPGGLLRHGIPEFRLPEDVLDREIARIEELGVTFATRTPVDREALLALARTHDAVLVATGLQELQALRLGIGGGPGEERIEQALVFLDRVNAGAERVDGEDVVVVGGGNTAMDAARSALRLGARSVRVVYRRSRSEMPAIPEEVDEALEEGVHLDVLVQPVAARPIRGHEGLVTRLLLTCRSMALGEADASGRARPVEIEGSDFHIPCDRVLLALGQSRDVSIFPEGTEVRERGQLLGLLETPVFAVGDLATSDGTVAAAIGSGRRAALHLDGVLNDRPVAADVLRGPSRSVRGDVDVWRDDVVGADTMHLHLFERLRPGAAPNLPPYGRATTFDEVHLGLEDPSEAKRCLSCGVCNDCDLCITYCPDGVLKRVGADLVFDYGYCKGCGICVAECPRDVVFMSHL